jgi:DNA sulfur modification protein DndB
VAEKIATISGVVRKVIEAPDGKTREYFVGTIRSDQAKELTFVPVALVEAKNSPLNQDLENGYQRQGSPSRMRKFTEFLLNNPLSVIPPVVLSGRSNWKFSGEGDFGVVDIYGPAAVIDGQHRLGGLVVLHEKHKLLRSIDFILVPDLSLQDEETEFMTINSKQRGVAKNLITWLEDSNEAQIAQRLNDEPGSPFEKRITITQARPGELFSFASMVKNIGRTFDDGRLEGLHEDTKYDYLTTYWEYIADTFDDEWRGDLERLEAKEPMQFKLLETTGLIAWSIAAKDILAPSFNAITHTMDWNAVRMMITTVRDNGLDLDKNGEFANATGEVGGPKIARKIQSLLPTMSPHSVISDE